MDWFRWVYSLDSQVCIRLQLAWFTLPNTLHCSTEYFETLYFSLSSPMGQIPPLTGDSESLLATKAVTLIDSPRCHPRTFNHKYVFGCV